MNTVLIVIGVTIIILMLYRIITFRQSQMGGVANYPFPPAGPWYWPPFWPYEWPYVWPPYHQAGYPIRWIGRQMILSVPRTRKNRQLIVNICFLLSHC